MLTCIRSKRQRDAAEYALRTIQTSCIRPYIKKYICMAVVHGEKRNIAVMLICFWNCQSHSAPGRNLKNIFIF